MDEKEIIKKTNEFINTLNEIIYDESDWYDYEELESAKEQLPVMEGLLDLYNNLKEIEEEHRKENGLLRVELKDAKEQLNNFYEGELYTAKQLKNLDEGKKKYYIHKDKIKTILGTETNDEEALLSLLETIVDENNRLEDIEDKKVQIEYNNVFNKGAESVKDKMKEKIEKIITQVENDSSVHMESDEYDYANDCKEYCIDKLKKILEG